MLVAVFTIIFIGWLVVRCSSSSEPTDKERAGKEAASSADAAAKKAAAAEQESKCRSDLQCWGDKAIVGAGVYCKEPVEKLANYTTRWKDGTFDTKFDRFRWLNKDKGWLTMIGDKIEFQNGFGAYQNVIYECDFDPATHAVLDVRARPGRL